MICNLKWKVDPKNNTYWNFDLIHLICSICFGFAYTVIQLDWTHLKKSQKVSFGLHDRKILLFLIFFWMYKVSIISVTTDEKEVKLYMLCS